MDVDANDTGTKYLVDHLPRVEWMPRAPLLQYKGFWIMRDSIEPLPLIETQYNPLPTDVIIASFPKSGTTWLKAITFAIMHNHYPNDPLRTRNPHQLVLSLEEQVFRNPLDRKIDDMHSPRILSTHLPYSILPKIVKDSTSGSKIIYISRNPADVIVSGWNFHNKMYKTQKTLKDYFNDFINGTVHVGPHFDHVLEYWEARESDNILFITYEGLKAYPNENVKKIAEFLGYSLSNNEIEKVVWKTSFERLSKLDINTDEENGFSTKEVTLVPYKLFFRNGNVGDGKSCLSPEMMERLIDITYEKWGGSGLLSKLCVAELKP